MNLSLIFCLLERGITSYLMHVIISAFVYIILYTCSIRNQYQAPQRFNLYLGMVWNGCEMRWNETGCSFPYCVWMGFYLQQMVFIQPTTYALINVTDFPFFVVPLNEIEHAHFERVFSTSKTCDLKIIMKVMSMDGCVFQEAWWVLFGVAYAVKSDTTFEDPGSTAVWFSYLCVEPSHCYTLFCPFVPLSLYLFMC